ncbi:pyridoxal phosphate-dependent aminotransferase [Telmatobacter bradus]|uniref:pyridoxal phosphate-dependent aminotransferase n=1 Tax=Telmatobacter bradus TaxID=474953 RepID=UPI003B4385EB
MLVSKTIAAQLENSSWIRRMFEEGTRLKKERGADKVFDFSLGNPVDEPPAEVLESLRRLVSASPKGSHGYMPNPGYMQVRERLAKHLAQQTGLPYAAEDVFMTVGAAGACNVVLKALLDAGDEVIVLAPYFVEYNAYITNHGGKMVLVDTDESFLPDVEKIRSAITPRTRAIMINTPNNPTGRVYPEETLRALNQMLAEVGQPIAVLSDEPYTSFVYDGQRQTLPATCIKNTIVCSSWSKSLGLAGERIGYVAISPRIEDRALLSRACALTNRILGFVNAPALWQQVLLDALDARVDAAPYELKRNTLCDALAKIGYAVRRPQGAFYIFLKTPIADDVAFTRRLAEEGVLAVPGTGFGRSGYIRLALTVSMETVTGSIPGFAAAFEQPQPAK